MRHPEFSLGTKMGLVASLILSLIVLGGALIFVPSPSFLFLALLILLTVLVTCGIFLLLSRWYIDQPIQELIHVMTMAPASDFLLRAPVRAQDVIGRLSQSFNRLLEQITTLDAFKLETERQLVMVQQELKYKQEMEEKNRELSLLYDFSQEVSMTLEPDELYDIVDSFLGERLGFTEFAFLVVDETAPRLIVKVARGFFDPTKVLGMNFHPKEGITGRVWIEGKSCYLPNTRQNPEYLHYKGEKREDGAFLSLPIRFKKNMVGVLNMFRPKVNGFSEGERKFLETLASELAIALVNAKLYSKTRELSVRDELTQVYNRRHFQEALPLEIKRAERFQKSFSLLMIDIDYFKKWNDTYGHLAGDACLKEFVSLIQSKIREVDFFARFGGEEFVLILPDTPKKEATHVAEKIRTLVKEHRFLMEGIVDEIPVLTISIGVAAYPEDGLAMEELIDSADVALYRAKQEGRDRVIVATPPLLSANLPNTASS